MDRESKRAAPSFRLVTLFGATPTARVVRALSFLLVILFGATSIYQLVVLFHGGSVGFGPRTDTIGGIQVEHCF